jgi:hypothetical protein
MKSKKEIKNMGWTYTSKNDYTSVADFFKAEFDFEREKTSGKVLACSMNGSTAYIAFEVKSPEETRVIAIICLTSKRSRDFYNFGYKDMDEHCGPYQTKCPKKILNLLTPLKEGENFAKEWRENCWKRLFFNRNHKG